MDRRKFLKTAVLTTAGAGLLAPCQALARGIPAGAFPGLPHNICYPGPPAGVITTSLTDLFKVGPGPSSSHTLAPLRIANDFRALIEKMPSDRLGGADHVEAHLFGSLSSTGKGHRTDRAILAGLLGQKAETCDPAVCPSMPKLSRTSLTGSHGSACKV